MIDPVCLRALVKRYRSAHQFESAVFWAEKLVAHGKQQFEDADPGAKRDVMLTYESDLLALGELFMLKGEFLRASRILGKYTIPSDSPNATQIRYQIAKCLFEARQFCEALELLNAILAGWNDSGCAFGTRKNLKSEFERVSGTPRPASVRPARTDGARRSTNANTNVNSATASVRKRQSAGRSGESSEMRAACLLLLAKVHMELESRGEACDLLRSALQLDPFCVEAWQILQRGALLSDAESAQLLRAVSQPRTASSETTEQPGASLRALLGDLCELRLHASNFAAGPPASSGGPRRFDTCISRLAPLRASVDVQLAAAERALALSNYAEALAITTRLLDEADSLHTDALVVHTAALVALRKANELFRLAHTLMDDADAGTSPGTGAGGSVPLQAVSWYVSAAYYYVVGNREACRKQAGRALQLAPSFVAGWLLVGHTLADEFEYDQAISAYSHANKLCRNAPQTLVCVALAYSRVRNARVAGEFLRAAYCLRTADPHTLNELGVLAYSERKYSVAVRFLRRAFRILTVTDVHADAEDADTDSVCIDFSAVRVALSGEWTPLINNLGHALRRAGALDEAIAAHRFALRLNVHHAPTWNALALALACAARFDDAAAAVERALRLSANDVFAYDLFEKLLAKLADATTACKLNDVPSGAASVTHNRYEPVGFEKVPDTAVDEPPSRMHTDSAEENTTKLKSDSDGDGASQIEMAFFRKLRERAATRAEEAASSASVFKVPRAAAWRASVVGVGVGTVPSTSSAHNESAAQAEVGASTSASNLDASACSSNNRSVAESDQSTTNRDDDGDVMMDC